MRFWGALGFFLAIMVLAAMVQPGLVTAAPTPAAVKAGPTLTVAGDESQRVVHSMRMITHRGTGGGDKSSMFCKMLCAMIVSPVAMATPGRIDSPLRHHEKIAVVGDVEMDQFTLRPQLSPPK